MAELRITILGCGSSGGVPRIGGHWGDCDPNDSRNRRRRCSILVEREDEGGTTRVLVDTSPDMNNQLLDAGIGTLDGVVYTHSHADHVHGIDDLRMIVFNMRQRLPVWAEEVTRSDLLKRFGYAFIQPEGSPYPPILELHDIPGGRMKEPLSIPGAGSPIDFQPFLVDHGMVDALGFRVANVAYTPDVIEIYPESWAALEGLDCWIVDALRRSPHPSHSHLENTLEWIEQAQPRQAVLTNMHIDLDYATVAEETPDNIMPAHDGLVLRFEV